MTDNTQDTAFIQEPRQWQGEGWTAQVIKNEDDDGWAVAMYKDGESEPALVGPWTMGRDKKNPKPLDGNAFITLVKTASEPQSLCDAASSSCTPPCTPRSQSTRTQVV